MSERLNGGPFTLGFGQQVFLEYWWGEGDDRQLAYASAHPVSDASGANFVSFDQRALTEGKMTEGFAYKYAVTIRNDATEGNDPTAFDVYATTP
jgi:hypothetical protein